MQKLKNLLTLFKSKISLNIFSFLGLLGIFELMLIAFALFFLTNDIGYVTDQSVITGYFGLLFKLYKFWLVVFIVDLMSNYRIKNKFILENKIYDIVWRIGFELSVFIIILEVILYFNSLYQLLNFA